MNNKNKVFLALIFTCTIIFSTCVFSQILPSNQMVVQGAKFQKLSQKKCKNLYNKFLKSDNWRKVESAGLSGEVYKVNNMKVKSKKIFDFDNDGVLEMWFESISSSKIATGEEISGFCTIVNGKVKMLLQGYVSGGTIGGDRIIIKFDKKTRKHVVGRSYFAGGFGGSLGGCEYYTYKNHKIKKLIKLYAVSQIRENYTEEELKGKHYVDREDSYEGAYDSQITIYEINDKRTNRKKYSKVVKRFVDPTNKKYIVG